MGLKIFTRKFFIIFFIILLMPCESYADIIKSKSKIAQVTVYPTSALVTRMAEILLKPGEHSVVFEDIVSHLDENSLTVSGEGTASAKILGAQVQREYLQETSDDRVKELETALEAVKDQINHEDANLSILNEEREFLESIKLFSGQQLPKDLVTSMPEVSELEGVLGFLSTKFVEIENKKEKINFRIRDLRRKQNVLNRELSQLRSTKSKMQCSIVVDVQCQKTGKLFLYVSYSVSGVSWRPIYTARASIEKGAVELSSFGIIKQSTGEDWDDVEFALSTARPTIGGRMPYVNPWILRPYLEHRKKEALLKTRMARGLQEQQYQAFDQLAEKEVLAAAGVATSQIQETGIAVNFKIPRKVTIKADGTEHKLPLASQTLKAEYQYSSFPKATPYAYLGSRVKNAKDLQLLAGRVNIFLEGDFVGTSSIDNIGPGEDFDLYLGVDENVKVKRELIKKRVDDVLIGNIRSSTKKTISQYKLTVENYKKKVIKFKLFEAMPVSENDRIRVKMFDVSLKPTQKDWKDRKGIWLWELNLKPRAKKEIVYSFSVEHPRQLQVQGF